MKKWQRLVAQLHTPGRSARSQGPFQVVNLTRHTTLATRLTLADTPQTREKGLLGRDGLAAGEGLWIVPCQAIHMFFMRFAIDLVYIDRRKRVRKVRSSVAPWRISACLSAHSVLELPAGTVRQTSTERGDLLEISPASQVAPPHVAPDESSLRLSGDRPEPDPANDADIAPNNIRSASLL
jgi:uncharacterized membrane protein (UPF0127 family)